MKTRNIAVAKSVWKKLPKPSKATIEKLQQPQPFIRWKACEQAFYLDALKITVAQAAQYWFNGGATFMPFAAEQMKHILLVCTSPSNIIDLQEAIIRDLSAAE